LEQTKDCPGSVYKLMRWSWKEARADRPTIVEMQESFTEIMKEILRDIENELNHTYIDII